MSTDQANELSPIQPDSSLFPAYAERADVIFWAADPQTFQLVYVSPHAEGALGMAVDEWLRPSFWQDHLHTADVDRVLTEFATAVSDQDTHLVEYRLDTADGASLWFRDRVCVLPHQGKPLLCGMMTDVTAFKAAIRQDTGTPGYTSIFLEIVTLLSSNMDIQSSLDQLAERLRDVFDLATVRIMEWNAVWGVVAPLAEAQKPTAPLISAKDKEYDNKILANVIDSLSWQGSQLPIIFRAQDSALSKWMRVHLANQSAQTLLCVPLVEQGDLIGCIELLSARVRTFSTYDIELMQVVARQTAVALTRAQLFQAEASRRREAEILLDISEFVSSSLDRDEILRRVMEILRVYLSDVHNCSISLISEDRQHLDTITSWWAEEKFSYNHPGLKVAISDTFSSQLAIQEGEAVIISDLNEIPFANEYTHKMMKEGLRAILCVPLKVQGRVLGTMHVNHWYVPRRFSAEEVALLQGVANQAAIAIENARLFANERRQLHLSQTLQKVGALLTTSLQLEEVYDQIFDLLGQVVVYDSASLFLLDAARQEFVMVAGRGFEEELFEGTQLRLASHIIHQKFLDNETWAVIRNVNGHPAWVFKDGLERIRAWIGALLLVKGEQIGLLCVDSVESGHYSDEDGQTVAAFANQAAVAIENARLYDETMRQAKELAILNQIAQETAVALDIDIFLEDVTNLVGQELYSTVFGFILYDEKSHELRAHYSFQGVPQVKKDIIIPLENSIIGHVVLTGQPYYAPNVHEDPHYFSSGMKISSEMAVPLKVNYEVIGVINVESPELDAFSERDLDFLTTLAGSISAVLERARLYQTLKVQAKSLAEQVQLRTSELKMERDKLFAILESAGEAIILTDINAHILYANPAMERQSGYSRQELQLQNPRMLGSSLVPKTVFSDMWRHLLSHQRWTGELINQHKNGHVYDVAVAVTPITGADGEVTGYVSVQSDITRLKELERLKTEFIANVSHQLRTPLTNIKTYVSLLNKGKPEKFPRYFSVLHQEIDRLARLIQDLLDISRLDAEVAPNPNASTDLVEFWEIVWPSFVERAEREERQLEISLADDIAAAQPQIYMEKYQMEKLLTRLMDNALTHTNPAGIIQVSVGWQDDDQTALRLRVCDDGPGIPENERPYLFDRFYRGAQAVESGLPGNGLGLAVVKELLAQYGGTIAVESEVGVGSCFVVQLPLVKSQTGPSEPFDAG
ncbi:MAG: GAF domain-containing protein [Ardenticatenaceae bacterium]|nr:GAF domain-containing protein [Ardenticatenaceae bacterium]